MFNIFLRVDELSEIVSKIIVYMMKCYDSYSKETKKKIVQIQIFLEKQDSAYKIQIVYCGSPNFNLEELFEKSFFKVIKKLKLEQVTLAMICYKNETTFNHEHLETAIFFQNKIVFANKKINKATVRTYWDKYTSILLKNKVQEVDIKKFEEVIKNFINEHKSCYSRIRFVFMKDGHKVLEDSLDADISSCHAIATSMASIIENSSNEGFKKKCLDMWHANDSQEMNEKVFKKLMNHLENKH